MKENEKIDTNSKVAIVTGGAKGIGAEIVRTLAENGYIAVSYTHLTLPTILRV